MSSSETQNEKNVYSQLNEWRKTQINRTAYIALLCVAVGIIAGIGSVGFRYLINFFTIYSFILQYPSNLLVLFLIFLSGEIG